MSPKRPSRSSAGAASAKRPAASAPSAPPAPAASAAAAEFSGVERLRQARVRVRADQTLRAEMDRAIHDAARTRRALGGCAEAWARVVPPELIDRTALQGVSRGVLTVRVPDNAIRFQLDRFLRGGGQRAFVAACPASLRQVRIVVGR